MPWRRRKKSSTSSSEGRYVDEVSIVVAGYSDMPLPEALEEAWFLSAGVGARVDYEGLVDELEAKAVPKPFALSQRWSHFSWGADGASLQIVLEMSTVVGGIAGVVYLAQEITRRIRRFEAPSAVDVEQATRRAQSQLAALLKVPENAIKVVEAKPRMGKVSLMFETPVGDFKGTAEADGLVHLVRKTRREPPST